MSFGGTRTKKVTTYGRRKTQIINVHSDFSPVVTSRQSPLPDPSSPLQTRPSRPPLSSILSNNIILTPDTDETSSKPKVKPKSTFRGNQPKLIQKRRPNLIVISDTSDSEAERIESPTNSNIDDDAKSEEEEEEEEEEIIIHRPRRKNVIPLSPPSSRAPSTPPPPRPRQTRRIKTKFDGVELITRRHTREPSLGLADRFAEIHIQSSVTPPHVDQLQPTSNLQDISQLLDICSSTSCIPFESFQSSPIFVSTVWPKIRGRALASSAIRKIGEASYSEVFGLTAGNEEIVVKVIPLVQQGDGKKETGIEGDRPDCSDCEDVKREIEVTKRVSSLAGGGFIDFLGAFVVQGQYPKDLVDEWDDYKAELGTESIRPDCFDEQQQYALIVLSHGGPDLESFRFDTSNGWVQAAGIFWQVAIALAKAEESMNFEHRDLHEGQILLQTTPLDSSSNDYSEPASCGITATIIDFGLSRLDMLNDGVAWVDLPEDVYEGVGEQWDVYRRMRDTVKGDWKGFHPITNVMWLSYLCRYLIHSKGLRKPRMETKVNVPITPLRPTRRLVTTPMKRRPVTREVQGDPEVGKAWSMLHQVEEVLGACFEGGAKAKRGKKVVARVGMASAGVVVAWGKGMGWIA